MRTGVVAVTGVGQDGVRRVPHAAHARGLAALRRRRLRAAGHRRCADTAGHAGGAVTGHGRRRVADPDVLDVSDFFIVIGGGRVKPSLSGRSNRGSGRYKAKGAVFAVRPLSRYRYTAYS